MNYLSRRSIAVVFAFSLAGTAAAQDGDYVAGRLLIQFRPGVAADQATAILGSAGARETSVISRTEVKIVSLPAAANETAIIRAFQQRPEVLFAELDRKIRPSDITPNDPAFTYAAAYLKKISAPLAWSTTTGSPLIIAILDTGVDATHEDLAAKIVAGWNIFANSSNTADIYGHGTQVAGIAAAVTNNAIGVSGVCWGCWIMPVRISDDAGFATYSAAANGITWAADHGSRIANLSYGMSASATVGAAAKYLWDRGGILTVSSGNEGTYDSTADNPYLLTVGATDASDVIYSWSNRGNNLDLVAPGCVSMATARGGGYTTACGTSFSAPIVAGVAALVLSANPGLTAAAISSAVRGTTNDLGTNGWDGTYGTGRVNAAAAVAQATGGVPPPPADTQPPTISILSPVNGSSLSGTATVLTSSTDNVGVTAVEFSLDGALKATVIAAPFNWVFATPGTSNGAHTIGAKARDAAGNTQTANVSVLVSNLADTQPPTVSVTAPSAGATVSGNASVSAVAADNVAVTQVQFYADGKLIGTSTAAPYTVRWNTQNVAKGAHSLYCRALDSSGNNAISATVTVYK